MPTKPTKVKHLQVSTPTGTAGQLHLESQYVFNYETTDRVNEVSLTMPIRAQSYATGGWDRTRALWSLEQAR